MITITNPYTTETEANDYFGQRLETEAWDNATSVERSKALLMSTRLIDRLNFLGEKTNPEQELEFPRGGDTATPDAIKIACAEMALSLLDGWKPDVEVSDLGVVSQGIASVRATYDRTHVSNYVLLGLPSQYVYSLIAPFLRDGNDLNISRV